MTPCFTLPVEKATLKLLSTYLGKVLLIRMFGELKISNHFTTYISLCSNCIEGLPISSAASNGHEQVVQYLLDNGTLLTKQCLNCNHKPDVSII